MKKVIGVALLLVAILTFLVLGFRQHRDSLNKPEGPLSLPESNLHLSILHNGQVQDMDLNTYLWGVVAAEMPASFSQEALNAQAVAARTYALSKAGHATNHPQADLCTDFHCCQAWISKAQAEEKWGKDAVFYANKITTAVTQTHDDVILYNGALIDAVFHSSSSGATQDAVAVWGNQVPYLQSVPSPEGDDVPNYHSTVTIPYEEFRTIFLAAHPEAVLESDPYAWISSAVHTPEGSVQTITIGGVSVTGSQARSIFRLRGPSFTVTPTPEGMTFQVTGFGHGVGMSQYGANTMAKEGKSYPEILQHYYTGVTIAPCPPELLPKTSASQTSSQ